MRPLVILLLVAALGVVWRGIDSTGLVPGLHVGGLLHLAFVGTFALPLLFLLWRQLRHAGARTMALTAGAGLVLGLGLMPIAVLMTLFAGFATSREQLYWLFHLWALIGLLLVLGALAFGAQRRLRTAGEAAGWPGAIVLPLVYVVGAHAVAMAVGQFEVATQHGAQANQYRAKEALRQIGRCAGAAASAPGAAGYPVRLDALGPSGTGCLAADVTAGTLPGYAIEYLAAPPDPQGRVTAFTTCARPTAYPRGGGTTSAGHSTVDEIAENGNPARVAPMNCAEAWHYHPGAISSLLNLSACAIRYVRARPQIGYPASLDELHSVGCTVPAAGLHYRPGPAEWGPRTRFEATAAGSAAGHYGSFFIDESGVLRFAAQGEAGPSAPAWRDVLAAEAAAQRALAAQRAAAGRSALTACEGGDADACDRYAEHALFDLNRSDEAERHFRRACEGGRELACLSIFANDPSANETYHTGIGLRRQCRDGRARACEGLTRLRRGMTREQTRELEDWVRSSGS